MFDLMEQSEKSHIWLDAHQQELTEKYPDRWAAVDQNGLIATASTQAELIENIKEKGINVKTTAMRLLETEPPEMIFRFEASTRPSADRTLPARLKRIFYGNRRKSRTAAKSKTPGSGTGIKCCAEPQRDR